MASAPCSGEAVVKAEDAAVELYQFAALMLGNEAEALSLVESTVAGVEIDPCADPGAAKGLVRERVLDGALEIMQRQDPASFAYIPATDASSPCLDEDGATEFSPTEVADMVTGTGHAPLRDWLAQLSQAQRAVFVQRAVLGSSNVDTARAINRYSKPSIWTAEAVGSLFRQALCSLASSLQHAVSAAQV